MVVAYIVHKHKISAKSGSELELLYKHSKNFLGESVMRTWEIKLMGPLFLCEEYLHRAADLTLVMSQALGKEMNAVGASTGNLLLQNTQWTACVCAGWGLCTLKGLNILFKLFWS
jgi:hypothetical protein